MVQTIEKTGKLWKAVRVAASLTLLTGLTIYAGMWVMSADPNFESTAVRSWPLIIAGMSVPVYVVGRIGAWWFHG